MVFASGVLGDVHMYGLERCPTRRMTDALVLLGHRVVRYDMRGMGSSDREVAGFTLEERVSDLEAVVERLELERFPLAGRDWGTATAATYALQHPERVSCLVLLSPWRSGRPRYETIPSARAIATLETMAVDDWAFAALAFAHLATTFEDPSLAKDLAAAVRTATSPENWIACRQETQKIELTSVFNQLAMPVLVVHEKAGRFGSFDLCREVAAAIPNSRFLSVEFSAESAAIDDFLRSEAVEPGARSMEAPDGLSSREVEVLQLLADGMSNQQIAEELVLSLNTVKRHVSNILTKTACRNRADATSYAHRQRLV